MPKSKGPPPKKRGILRTFLSKLGPGLISGAADDDPSGIATYSVTGASFGYGPLWTALFSFPLMVAVQLMCARLGMVTGRGLASAIRNRYPRWVLFAACAILIVANVINIGADLGGMGEATEMVTGVSKFWWTPAYAAIIVLLLIATTYRRVASVLKWLATALFAYVIVAFIARPDWPQVLRATLIPDIQWNSAYLSVLVGILGTTISPYLFFWQAAQEVEEERSMGRTTQAQRQGATDEELRDARTDVLTGMFCSNAVMYFVILTTAATLHTHGMTHIETARQAAEALRPLAGAGAYWLFTLGLVGTGLLAVPVLAGSCAYAIAEACAWHGSLNARPRQAIKFYSVLAACVAIGLALVYAGVPAVKMLFWSAVANGVLAPPLIVLIALITSDPAVMGERVNPGWLRALGWLCAIVMGGAAVCMFAAG